MGGLGTVKLSPRFCNLAIGLDYSSGLDWVEIPLLWAGGDPLAASMKSAFTRRRWTLRRWGAIRRGPAGRRPSGAAVCSECGSRWPRGGFPKFHEERRELCRLCEIVPMRDSLCARLKIENPRQWLNCPSPNTTANRLSGSADGQGCIGSDYPAGVRGACDLLREARGRCRIVHRAAAPKIRVVPCRSRRQFKAGQPPPESGRSSYRWATTSARHRQRDVGLPP